MTWYKYKICRLFLLALIQTIRITKFQNITITTRKTTTRAKTRTRLPVEWYGPHYGGSCITPTLLLFWLPLSFVFVLCIFLWPTSNIDRRQLMCFILFSYEICRKIRRLFLLPNHSLFVMVVFFTSIPFYYSYCGRGTNLCCVLFSYPNIRSTHSTWSVLTNEPTAYARHFGHAQWKWARNVLFDSTGMMGEE